MGRDQVGVEQNASKAVVGSELQFGVRRHRRAPDHLRAVAGNVLNEGTTTEVGDQFGHQRGRAVLQGGIVQLNGEQVIARAQQVCEPRQIDFFAPGVSRRRRGSVE